jgi:hypothetical protein
VIAKFTASLESPCIWDTYSFEGVTPGIRRVTSDDMPRGTVSQGGGDKGTSPTIGPIERGQYEHWALVASVLEHRDNVGPPWLEVAFLLLILSFIHCFSIVIPVQLGSIQRHVPARCVCCDSASM